MIQPAYETGWFVHYSGAESFRVFEVVTILWQRERGYTYEIMSADRATSHFASEAELSHVPSFDYGAVQDWIRI